MLFPVRCFTCNKAIGGRYREYIRRRDKYRREKNVTSEILLTSATTAKDVGKMAKRQPVNANKQSRQSSYRTAEARAMDELHMNRYCCRRHFMCDIDIIDI